MIAFDTPSAVLGSHLVTARSGLARLQRSEAMHDHVTTINGASAMLRFFYEASPIGASTYLELRAVAEDLRDVWEHVRIVHRQEANWLCDIDLALQGAAQTVYEALDDHGRDVARSHLCAKEGI